MIHETYLTCRLCGQQVKVQYTDEQVQKLQNKELIQNVFPEWTLEQREMLLSQTCQECWDEIFKEVD